MSWMRSLVFAAVLAAPASLRAAPRGWIPEIGGGVEASEVRQNSDHDAKAGCEEPSAGTFSKSSCKGTLTWDEKACKHVCVGAKGEQKKAKKKKKAKKAKKKKEKYDDAAPHEIEDGVEFSCKNPPAVTQSAKSSCPGNLLWNEKACKHVCQAPEVDCSGLNSKKCKNKKKKAKQKFNKAMKKSGQDAKKPAKKLKVKAGFGALREQK